MWFLQSSYSGCNYKSEGLSPVTREEQNIIERKRAVRKRALLISAETESQRGCTNDVIEYTTLLVNVYGFKEIRILQSELSEKLYGHFVSLALNRVGGAVIQISRLTRQSFIEGFEWLVSLHDQEPQLDCFDLPQYNGIGRNSSRHFVNPTNSYFEFVLVYCGLVRESQVKEETGTDSRNSEDPEFVIFEEECVSFSELENLVMKMETSPARGIQINLTCFMDCRFGYSFLSKYTKSGKDGRVMEAVGSQQTKELSHQRITTMPDFANRTQKEEFKRDGQIFWDALPPIFVLICSSCSRIGEEPQELALCSSNGIGLSIMYRRLFSYCMLSVLKQNIAITVGEGIPKINLKYLLEVVSASMGNLSLKNGLESQNPMFLVSPGVSIRDQVLLGGSTTVLNYNANHHVTFGGKGFGQVSQKSPKKATGIDTNFCSFFSRNQPQVQFQTPYQTTQIQMSIPSALNSKSSPSEHKSGAFKVPFKNPITGSKRVYAYDNTGRAGEVTRSEDSVLIKEISQLRSELSYLRQSIRSGHGFSGGPTLYPRGNFTGYHSHPVQIFNSDAIFKKTTRNSPVSSGHQRTFTSK
ncbi:conserved transmembrane protein [Cryptosporidium felis]|nr:conserved transmembrane protein [Cryptosporidium felis]